jgi:hypothetical protein
MTRRSDKRSGAYAEVSGRADRHRADMRDRMRRLRAARRKSIPGPIYTSAPPARPAADLPPVRPLGITPTEDHPLTWGRPPQPSDRELLGRMLAKAESEHRPLAAESIRARLASLGAP